MNSENTTIARIELIRIVSNRLFTSLVALLVLVLSVIVLSSFFKEISAAGIVILSGQIGGFVGLQRRLKQMSDHDLELITRSWLYTVLSPLVGGILALLLFILFLSDLLQGDFFPKFVLDGSGAPQHYLSLLDFHGAKAADYAKLIFWSFLAGYSEKFVIDIVSQFEKTEIH